MKIKSYTTNFELAKRLARHLFDHSREQKVHVRKYECAKRAARYYKVGFKMESEIEATLKE